MKKTIALSVFGALALPLFLTSGANAVTFIDNNPNKGGIVITDAHVKAGETFNLNLLSTDKAEEGYKVESVRYSMKSVDGTKEGLTTTLSEDKSVIAVKVADDETNGNNYRVQVGVSLVKDGAVECSDTGCVSGQTRIQANKQFTVKVSSMDNKSSSDTKTENDDQASSDTKTNSSPVIANNLLLKLDKPLTVVVETPKAEQLEIATPATAKPTVKPTLKPVPAETLAKAPVTKQVKAVTKAVAPKATKAPVSRSKALEPVKQTETTVKATKLSDERTAPVSKVNEAKTVKLEVESPVVVKSVSEKAVHAPKSRVIEYKPTVKADSMKGVVPVSGVDISTTDSYEGAGSSENRGKFVEVSNGGQSVGSVPDTAKRDKSWHKATNGNQSVGNVPTGMPEPVMSDEPTNQEVFDSANRATDAFTRLMIPMTVIALGIGVLALGVIAKGALKVRRFVMKRKK